MQIGTIFPNINPMNQTGLHVTLSLNKDTWEDFLGRRKNFEEGDFAGFIDPLDPKRSPFACPDYEGTKTVDGYSIPK
jgi:hypothetical protein